MAATQRRWSTSSLRNTLAITALTMKVSEAEAGATRLRSPQESAVSRLKKPMLKQHSDRKKSFSEKIFPITTRTPRRARSSSRSPMRFMAAESRTSPLLEASTIMAMANQSSSDFMLLLAGANARFPLLGRRQSWSTRDPAHAATDEQHSQPAQRRDVFVQEILSDQGHHHVTERGRGQDIAQVSPGERRKVGDEKCHQADDPQ